MGLRTTLTETTKRDIRRMRRDGHHVSEIAERLSVSPQSVWRYSRPPARRLPKNDGVRDSATRFAALLSVDSDALAAVLQQPGVRVLDINPE